MTANIVAAHDTRTDPGIIVIDDEMDHLTGLADGLDRHGMSCHRVHCEGELAGIGPWPDVRLIVADLHLGSGVLTVDPTTDFSVIGGLLEEAIRPSGPYMMVLWTMYPEQAPALRTFLLERLQEVAKPFDVLPLAKADYLDGEGNVRDEPALVRAITDLAAGWAKPEGALALLGAWGELDDDEVDALIEEIYASRRRDIGRPVELED